LSAKRLVACAPARDDRFFPNANTPTLFVLELNASTLPDIEGMSILKRHNHADGFKTLRGLF
jgi:hypothetical protein